MLPLASLPVELLELLANELDDASICALRLASSYFASVLQRYVYRTLCFDMRVDLVRSTHDKLAAITNGDCPAIRNTHNLVIRSLCTHTDGLGPDGRAFGATPPVPQDYDIHAISERALDLLLPALRLLQNVTSVWWRRHPLEGAQSNFLVPGILSVIVEYPGLRSFELYGSDERGSRYLQLQKLKNLERLLLYVNTLGWLHRIIPNCPNLQVLETGEIERNTMIRRPSNLNHLFDLLPAATPPLWLHHLALGRSTFVFDQRFFNLTSLQHLTSISIKNLINHYSNEGIHASEPGSRNTSKTEAVWVFLTSSGVKLQEIDVDHLPPTLMDYLATGVQPNTLRKLRLRVNGFQQRQRSVLAAKRFWEEILPRHAGSLRDLLVTHTFSGAWSYSSETASRFALCRHLRFLGVSFGRSLGSARSRGARLEAAETVADLFRMTSQSMPWLEAVTIIPVTGGRDRRARGTWEFSCLSIEAALRRYIVPRGMETSVQTVQLISRAVRFCNMFFRDSFVHEGGERIRFKEDGLRHAAMTDVEYRHGFY